MSATRRKPPPRWTPQQIAEAQAIYSIAVGRGVPPQRAAELVMAALAESTLNRKARNPKSGAAGDFQLLSRGYVDRANKLGGVYNTRANELAILPDYERYWHDHPHARTGEAARDVERSGEGAGFYDRDLTGIPLGGKGAVANGGPAGAAAASPMMVDPGPNQAARAQLAMTLIRNVGAHGHPDIGGLGESIQQLRESEQPRAVAPPQPVQAPQADAGWAFPVAGAPAFGNDWGAPRPGHAHAGIDIPAAEGTPILAVRSGVVTAAGPSGAAGNRLWIDGQWFYAHLSRYAKGIKPGARVRAGQVIGYVGHTGDATGPHLHFGWSPNRSSGRSWRNPYELLVRLRGR